MKDVSGSHTPKTPPNQQILDQPERNEARVWVYFAAGLGGTIVGLILIAVSL